MPTGLTRREALRMLGTGALTLSGVGGLSAPAPGKRPPNFVVIFTDDQGYADAGCYGARGFETPNLDRMAATGVRFTDFYAAHASCSPSRAGLLTGCYPLRVGIPNVLGPHSAICLNPTETLIPEMLEPLGYRSICIGKWHLGDTRELLPTHQGFDEFFGLPYSNDMWPVGYDGAPRKTSHYPPLPLIEGDAPVRTIATLQDQDQLTTLYTDRAVRFIRENRERPFFLYLAHSMPHVPLGVSKKFRGRSKQGLYGDVIMEIDWSTGAVLRALRENGLSRDTLVVFTSDNGPWLNFGNHAGSALPLRSGKGTTWDGGQREICVMQWPGHMPPGTVCRELACAIDLLPTFAVLSGAKLPERKIDGRSIAPLILGAKGAKSPHEALFFHYGGRNELQCVRSGKWKMHFPHSYRKYEGFTPGKGGFPGRTGVGRTDWALYDLDADIGERHDVKDRYPEVFQRLKALGEAHDEEIRANARPPARVRRPRQPRKPKIVTRGKHGEYMCMAVDSRIHGHGDARYVSEPGRQNIGMWHQLESWVDWQVRVHTPGTFRVLVKQAAGPGNGPSEYTVTVGGRKRRGIARETRGWKDYIVVDLGTVEIKHSGLITVAVKPVRIAKRAVMNLRSVTLQPVGP